MLLETLAGAIPAIIDKVKGKSTPDTGQKAGQYAKDYFDTLAPGTTQWERVGASTPAGSVLGARVGADQGDRAVNKQIMAQMAQSRDTNRAHVVASGAQYGPEASQALLDVYDGRKSTPYDTPTKQGREKTDKTSGIGSLRSRIEDDAVPFYNKTKDKAISRWNEVKSGQYWTKTKANARRLFDDLRRKSTPRNVDIDVRPAN